MRSEEAGSAGMQPAAPLAASKMELGALLRSFGRRESPQGDRPKAGDTAGDILEGVGAGRCRPS